MQNILVTGASRGIGRAIAVKLASKDSHFFIHGRDQKELNETDNRINQKGGRSTQVIADISTVDGYEQIIESVGQESLSVLVNNAGISVVKSVEELTFDDWNRTLSVNVTAPFYLTQQLLPLMKEGSSIVNILSIAAKGAFPGWSSYCMSKYALRGFAESLREELRPKGIRVINVYPSAVATDIWEDVPGDWPKEKMMSPDEVAESVAFALERPTSVLVEDITIGNLAGQLN